MRAILALACLLCLPMTTQALSVRLAWDYVPNPDAVATEFHVYRQQGCQGAFVQIATIPVATLGYTDPMSLVVSTDYCWIVKAGDALGQESTPSNTVRFRLSPAPQAPNNVRGTVVP